DDGIRVRNVTGVQTCALPISTAMQWPPTPGPGCKILTRGCRFASSMTSHTSIPNSSLIMDSSLAKAMLTSRNEFSTSFDISAVRSEERRVGERDGSIVYVHYQ